MRCKAAKNNGFCALNGDIECNGTKEEMKRCPYWSKGGL